jgi:proteasome lid subunit RPN8/RPN11
MNALTWKESTPDGVAEPLAGLTRRLGWADALALTLNRSPGIRIAPDAMRVIRNHVDGRRIEVGGLLLGESIEWPAHRSEYPFATEVSLAVPARQLSNSPVSLTMDTSVWNEARTLAPNLKVVGWFHSHPDLGAFFSGTDRNTQRHFFRLPHQIGLVIDSFREETACFAGAGSGDVTECLRRFDAWAFDKSKTSRP